MVFKKHLSSGMKKNQPFNLDGLITKDYKPLTEQKIDDAIKHQAKKMVIESSPLLREVKQLKKCDGLTATK